MRKGNAIIVVLILAALLVAGVFILGRRNSLMNTQNTDFSPAPTFQATKGNTNGDLQQDMNTIDSSLNTTNSSTTDVNAGINDTPIAQPNY